MQTQGSFKAPHDFTKALKFKSNPRRTYSKIDSSILFSQKNMEIQRNKFKRMLNHADSVEPMSLQLSTQQIPSKQSNMKDRVKEKSDGILQQQNSGSYTVHKSFEIKNKDLQAKKKKQDTEFYYSPQITIDDVESEKGRKRPKFFDKRKYMEFKHSRKYEIISDSFAASLGSESSVKNQSISIGGKSSQQLDTYKVAQKKISGLGGFAAEKPRLKKKGTVNTSLRTNSKFSSRNSPQNIFSHPSSKSAFRKKSPKPSSPTNSPPSSPDQSFSKKSKSRSRVRSPHMPGKFQSISLQWNDQKGELKQWTTINSPNNFFSGSFKLKGPMPHLKHNFDGSKLELEQMIQNTTEQTTKGVFSNSSLLSPKPIGVMSSGLNPTRGSLEKTFEQSTPRLPNTREVRTAVGKTRVKPSGTVTLKPKSFAHEQTQPRHLQSFGSSRRQEAAPPKLRHSLAVLKKKESSTLKQTFPLKKRFLDEDSVLHRSDSSHDSIQGEEPRSISPLTRKMNNMTKNVVDMPGTLSFNERLKDEYMKSSKDAQFKIDLSLNIKSQPHTKLSQTQKKIKLMKNTLKSLVEPEESKYLMLTANNDYYSIIDVMPDQIPTYCKLNTAQMKSPAQFVMHCNNNQDLVVYLSTTHKMPGPSSDSNNKTYEKKIVFQTDIYKKMMNIQKKFKKMGKMSHRGSIHTSETDEGSHQSSTTRFDMNKLLYHGMKGPPTIEKFTKVEDKNNKANALKNDPNMPKSSSRLFLNTEKSNFRRYTFRLDSTEEFFPRKTYIYLAFFSKSGGEISMKVEFPRHILYQQLKLRQEQIESGLKGAAPGTLQQQDQDQNYFMRIEETERSKVTTEIDYSEIAENLNSYRQREVYGTMSPQNKIRLNKDMAKHKVERAGFFQFAKILNNFERRARVAYNNERIQEYEQIKKRSQMIKWQVFRDQKLDLIANYIRILKRQSAIRKLLTVITLERTITNLNFNFEHRKMKIQTMISGIFLAIKFRRKFEKFKEKYGLDFTFRHLNILRRHMNFKAMLVHRPYEIRAKRLIRNAIMVKCGKFVMIGKFRKFIQRVIFLQRTRHKSIMMRMVRIKHEMNRQVQKRKLLRDFDELDISQQGSKTIKLLKQHLEKDLDPRINMDVLRFIKEIGPHNWTELAYPQVNAIQERYIKENQIITNCLGIRALVIENYQMEQQTDPNRIIQSLAVQKQNNIKIEQILKKIRKTHKSLKEQDDEMRRITPKQLHLYTVSSKLAEQEYYDILDNKRERQLRKIEGIETEVTSEMQRDEEVKSEASLIIAYNVDSERVETEESQKNNIIAQTRVKRHYDLRDWWHDIENHVHHRNHLFGRFGFQDGFNFQDTIKNMRKFHTMKKVNQDEEDKAAARVKRERHKGSKNKSPSNPAGRKSPPAKKSSPQSLKDSGTKREKPMSPSGAKLSSISGFAKASTNRSKGSVSIQTSSFDIERKHKKPHRQNESMKQVTLEQSKLLIASAPRNEEDVESITGSLMSPDYSSFSKVDQSQSSSLMATQAQLQVSRLPTVPEEEQGQYSQLKAFRHQMTTGFQDAQLHAEDDRPFKLQKVPHMSTDLLECKSSESQGTHLS